MFLLPHLSYINIFFNILILFRFLLLHGWVPHKPFPCKCTCMWQIRKSGSLKAYTRTCKGCYFLHYSACNFAVMWLFLFPYQENKGFLSDSVRYTLHIMQFHTFSAVYLSFFRRKSLSGGRGSYALPFPPSIHPSIHLNAAGGSSPPSGWQSGWQHQG